MGKRLRGSGESAGGRGTLRWVRRLHRHAAIAVFALAGIPAGCYPVEIQSIGGEAGDSAGEHGGAGGGSTHGATGASSGRAGAGGAAGTWTSANAGEAGSEQTAVIPGGRGGAGGRGIAGEGAAGGHPPTASGGGSGSEQHGGGDTGGSGKAGADPGFGGSASDGVGTALGGTRTVSGGGMLDTPAPGPSLDAGAGGRAAGDCAELGLAAASDYLRNRLESRGLQVSSCLIEAGVPVLTHLGAGQYAFEALPFIRQVVADWRSLSCEQQLEVLGEARWQMAALPERDGAALLAKRILEHAGLGRSDDDLQTLPQQVEACLRSWAPRRQTVGYRRYIAGALAEVQGSMSRDGARAACQVEIRDESPSTQQECFFDGERLGYDLFHDGQRVGYVTEWCLQASQYVPRWCAEGSRRDDDEARQNCDFNTAQYPGTTVRCFDGGRRVGFEAFAGYQSFEDDGRIAFQSLSITRDQAAEACSQLLDEVALEDLDCLWDGRSLGYARFSHGQRTVFEPLWTVQEGATECSSAQVETGVDCLFDGVPVAGYRTAGGRTNLLDRQILTPTRLPSGKTIDDVAGIAIDSRDQWYVWFYDQSLNSRPLEALFSQPYGAASQYHLPPGQTPSTMAAIAIDKTNDRVYSWYLDGTMAEGTPFDLAAHSYDTFTLPEGKDPEDIVGAAIVADGEVLVWYLDGTTSSGIPRQLATTGLDDYMLAGDVEPQRIVGTAAATDGVVYAWHRWR